MITLPDVPLDFDIWTYLKSTEKPIVMYGMGNGADKILSVLDSADIKVADFFASDGFVRGHLFHEKKVLSFSEVCNKYTDFIVLLAFGSSLDDVIQNILYIDEHHELYAPDVPVSGNILFNSQFYNDNYRQIQATLSLFADEFSKELFTSAVNFKLSGKLLYLKNNSSTDSEIFSLINSDRIKTAVDAGAYNGDTVRLLANYSQSLSEIIAIEPDAKSFKKLSAYANTENRFKVIPVNCAAYDAEMMLTFTSSANRNSFISDSGNPVPAVTIDRIAATRHIDYIKYDCEGSEEKAISGSREVILRDRPALCISAYHKPEDIFRLPMLIHDINPDYRLYLRRKPYIPAWDMCIYAI